MQLVFFLLTLLYYAAQQSSGVAAVKLPQCKAASTRALIKAAVQQQLVLHGIPIDPQLFSLLDGLKDATSPESQTIVAQVRAASSASFTGLRACEVGEPQSSIPMFVTIFVAGSGIPQPSAYVLNFGLPGAGATIGKPPQ